MYTGVKVYSPRMTLDLCENTSGCHRRDVSCVRSVYAVVMLLGATPESSTTSEGIR